ncbi:hypothetical protein L249_7394, partial [Ophiocordyceps polyrhachis-furcata BCC 54312]
MAFYKDMRYERLLFDFYIETGGSRFARGLANFVSIDTLDKDPILNPRESSSKLSDLFISSPTNPFAKVPSLILRA